jgi:hypothetical protein
MIVMLSRVELRNKYDFKSPFLASGYFVLTYHFLGTNLHSTNLLHRYGSILMPKLRDCKVRNTASGVLVEKRLPRSDSFSITEWNALMRQLEKELNRIVSQH